jgi:DNA-binding NtrC family response regulator
MESKGRLLLIVEDHLETRRSLGAMFSRRGWEVCLATTLAEAINLLDHGLEPDCLILDLRLPDGGGETVLRKVQKAKLRTRVIVCTGDSDAERAIRLWGMRPDLLLFKPVDATVICNLCDNLERIA